MKLRRPPKNIPLYSWKDAERYIKESAYNSPITEFIAVLCMTIALIPVTLYYFVKHLAMSMYTVVRYCTYSLNDKEEKVVQEFIKRKEQL